MYIRQLDTGEVRRLRLPKEFNDPRPESWFPDNTDLLFVEGVPRKDTLYLEALYPGRQPTKVDGRRLGNAGLA